MAPSAPGKTAADTAALPLGAADASAPKPELRTLFPPIEAYDEGFLQVGDAVSHAVYYQQFGNPDGKPVLVVHGGPGGGGLPYYAQYFNAAKWRIVMFDQRGCGKSTPWAELRENTTWDLVADMEKLREKFAIEKWTLFGGSWGSTLSLAYAETHPERVVALILRGIFTLRRSELEWYYQEGASNIYPDAFDSYLAPIPAVERADVIGAYYRRLTGDNKEEMERCAKAWTLWEMGTSCLIPDPSKIQVGSDPKFYVPFARIECHYFVNGGWFEEDGQLIKRAADRLKGIPGIIVQGRYDVVCPMKSAWELHKQWPESQLKVISDAGHTAKEPGIVSELVKAAEYFEDA